MTRIFRSAVFWVLVSGFLLGLALFFLLPLMGVKAAMPRLLGSLTPPVLAGIVALLISIFRLKRALKSQDATQTNPFESGLAVKPWLDPLKRETKEALEILKQSGRGKVRVGQNPLEVFRFYLVLGNSGAGKSSLLEHSGIHFPRRFPTTADLAKQTFHFTQWWFSNQGIFLETPSRYATGEEGDEEFQVWLSLLEREGKRIALDGVVLTVSLRELLEAGAGAQELASRYREKLALAMSTLRLELPIYLVFTHADLMPGFREFFENLQEPENHQVLGATFALRGNLAPARQRFEREYRKIWESLQARTPMRLAQLAEPRRRKPIFLFPNEFGAAQERLALFVEHLFKDSMRRERALFRGFFLTSVSPSQATDLVRGGADPFAEGEGAHFLDHKAKLRGPAASPLPEAAGRSRSLFTYLLFGGVLKSDKSLAQIPGYRLGNMSRRALITSGTMAVAAVGLCLYALWGYFESRSHLGELSKTITEAAQLRWRDPLDFRAEYAGMDRLLAAIRALDAGEAGSVPPGFRHSGEALDLAARAHGRQINRMAALGALRNLAATLEMGAKFYNPAEHGRLHDNLRLYLLLTPEGRKHFQDVKQEDFASWLGPLWSQEVVHRVGPENLPSNLETGLEDHAAYYARRYLDGKLPTLDRGDANLIASTRQALLGTPSIEGLYASIVGAEDPGRDLTLAEMGVPGDAALKSSSKVRGFYTKAAFDDNAMDRLAEGAEQPHRRDWVLGEGAATVLPPEMQDQRQLYRALIDRYYQDYADEWMHFLQSLSVRLPGEPGLASGKLSGFASTTQGLPAVLGRLSAEVNLLAPAGAGEKAAEGALKKKLGKASALVGMAAEARDADKKKLKEKFKFVEELNGTPGASSSAGAGLLQDYFTALKGLSEMMGKLALGGEGATDAMDAAIQLFSGKADSPLNACWNEANKVRTRYEAQTWLTPLLENPVRDVAGYLAATAGTQLESVYKAKVLAFYNQNLRGRYPLAKAGTQEVNLEDMKSFFNPDNGIFTAFVNGKLMPFLKPEDEGYSARHWNGIRLKFQPAALQGVSRGMAVSRRMYTDMPYALRVYNLNITLQEAKNTARVLFRLGEERIAVKPGEGQARLTFRWPNENSYKGAEILVENVNGGSQGRRVDGSWGFLKLLDGARALNVRTGGLTAKWRFNVAQKYDVDVSLEGNIPERENPFTFPDYYKFELPAGLTAEGDTRVSQNGR